MINSEIVRNLLIYYKKIKQELEINNEIKDMDTTNDIHVKFYSHGIHHYNGKYIENPCEIIFCFTGMYDESEDDLWSNYINGTIVIDSKILSDENKIKEIFKEYLVKYLLKKTLDNDIIKSRKVIDEMNYTSALETLINR